MKNIILFTIAMVYSFSTMGQQTVMLNDAESIKLPYNSEKVTKAQALAHANEKFNDDKGAQYSISLKNNSINYKIDNILIFLFPHNKTYNLKSGHLLAWKKGIDAMNNSDTSYKSYIKNVNNNSVLVTYNMFNSIAYYLFYCYNFADTRAIAGEIEFNLTDSNKASTILNDLLASIKFKD